MSGLRSGALESAERFPFCSLITSRQTWTIGTPKITNGLAAQRDVIIFDYPGIGRSTGATPSTVAAMKTNWHFTTPNARIKLKHLYPSI